MNRREALKAVAAALPVGCAAGELSIEAGDELIAFKVTSERPLSCAARENLKQVVKDTFAGTKWAESPVLVCDGGIDVQVVKRSDVEPVDWDSHFAREFVAID